MRLVGGREKNASNIRTQASKNSNLSTVPPNMMEMVLFSCLIAACSARAISYTNQSTPNCHDLMLNVPVKATTYDVGQAPVTGNKDVSTLTAEIDRWSTLGFNATDRIVSEVHIDDTFAIYAQLCLPKPETDKNVIQILSHGGAFDHRYCTDTATHQVDSSDREHILIHQQGTRSSTQSSTTTSTPPSAQDIQF